MDDLAPSFVATIVSTAAVACIAWAREAVAVVEREGWR